jgi:ATP-binding cassette subfamily B (MDR/TAP) protein 1
LTIQIPPSPVTESPFKLLAALPAVYDGSTRRHQSLQFTPTSAVFNFHQESTSDEDDNAWKEREAVQQSSVRARAGRENMVVDLEVKQYKLYNDNEPSPPSFWPFMRSIYSTISNLNKPMRLIGLLICLLNGSMALIFSFLLSRLLFQASTGAQNVSTINQFGGLILSISALDGLFLRLKYFVMDSEYCSITNLRSVAIQRILKQDKKWFDMQRHSPSDIVQ